MVSNIVSCSAVFGKIPFLSNLLQLGWNSKWISLDVTNHSIMTRSVIIGWIAIIIIGLLQNTCLFFLEKNHRVVFPVLVLGKKCVFGFLVVSLECTRPLGRMKSLNGKLMKCHRVVFLRVFLQPVTVTTSRLVIFVRLGDPYRPSLATN